MWAVWVGAFGILIEFVGFGTLAYELTQTNKSSVTENIDLARETSAFDTLTGYDGAGDPGGKPFITVEGGVLGKLIANIRSREDEMRKRTALILRGVAITAIGAGLQVVGSFGQVLQQAASQ